MSTTLARKLNFALNHWGIVLPVIIVASALAIHNFTQYTLSGDEFYSALVAGIVFESDLAPMSIVARLWSNGPDHMPGIFSFIERLGAISSLTILSWRARRQFTARYCRWPSRIDARGIFSRRQRGLSRSSLFPPTHSTTSTTILCACTALSFFAPAAYCGSIGA